MKESGGKMAFPTHHLQVENVAMLQEVGFHILLADRARAICQAVPCTMIPRLSIYAHAAWPSRGPDVRVFGHVAPPLCHFLGIEPTFKSHEVVLRSVQLHTCLVGQLPTVCCPCRLQGQLELRDTNGLVQVERL